jgi:hypothetical protein
MSAMLWSMILLYKYSSTKVTGTLWYLCVQCTYIYQGESQVCTASIVDLELGLMDGLTQRNEETRLL